MDKVKIIEEHTRLGLEFAMLIQKQFSAKASEAQSIIERKKEIIKRIDELRKIEETWEEYREVNRHDQTQPS